MMFQGPANRRSERVGQPAALRQITTRLLFTALVLLSAANRFAAADAISSWQDARQLVLVTTSDWDADHGVLRAFAMSKHGWQTIASPVAVTIGRSGSAWGVGMHDTQRGPLKHEGDGRSPAGVFRIGTAFGYEQAVQTRLHYTAMSESDYCIDVSTSPLYNRLVDARVVGEAAVEGSTEPMRRDLHADGDQRYKLGFVIEHNPASTAAAGSCIFAHLWRKPDEATSGCTAMDESTMRKLLGWLQPNQHPIFVLLPQAEYARVKHIWKLPELESSPPTARKHAATQ